MSDEQIEEEKTKPSPLAQLTASEQLMHSTVRLEMPDANGRTGTGFHFAFYKHEGRVIPAIITNRHVIEGANEVEFKLTQKGQDGLPVIGSSISFRLADLSQRTVHHPKVDLSAILIGDVIDKSSQQGTTPFYLHLDESLIPSEADLKQLSPLETVLTAGYPGQLWDDVNNLPLFHRGNTATAPFIDFRGKKEFLVDFATWPGSSGSPVFVFNEGGFFDGRTGNMMLGSSRVLLIGVVYGVAVQEVTGDVVIRQAPTGFGPTPFVTATNIPTNVGACLRASQILELDHYFRPLGSSHRPGTSLAPPNMLVAFSIEKEPGLETVPMTSGASLRSAVFPCELRCDGSAGSP